MNDKIICCSLEGNSIVDMFFRWLYKLGEWLEDDVALQLRMIAARHFCGGDNG